MATSTASPLTVDQAIGHEFINALASVRSLAELLVEYPGLDAGDRERFLTIIHDETERLTQLAAHMNRASGCSRPTVGRSE